LFYQDSQGIYRVAELDALPWLLCGFGTRHSDIPAHFGNLATLKQIHSSDCIVAEGRQGQLGHGDALLENTPGAVVAVKTADCLPILLADQRVHAVAAVHAGWRGTAAEIAKGAVAAMQERFSTQPEDLHAAIGPGIGPCCYEVGPEVAERFGLAGRVHLDLAAINRQQLLEAGIPAERICQSGLCTKCLAGDFHSFRRDREAAGRMYSFAGIAPL
jgi:polyphenol oxidase